MIIPTSEKTGFPTVSNTMLSTYGFAGFALDDATEPRGCPRQFQARYVDHSVDRPDNERLRLGRVIHEAYRLAEEEAIGLDVALEKVWDPRLPADLFEEAVADLRAYMERESSPFTEYEVWANELELAAQLYIDEDFGPIWYTGILDRLSVDPKIPNMVHVGDWKYVNNPPSLDDVRASDQLKGYDWLVRQTWRQIGLPREPRVVVHLDAIKFLELRGIAYTEEQRDAWHARTVAIVRAILRDDNAEPVINWGCSYCPVRDTCPAFLGLPDVGVKLLQVKPDDRARLGEWMKRVNATRLLLEKAFDDLNGRFRDDALHVDHVEAGPYAWDKVTRYAQRFDAPKAHDLLGDDAFYGLVSVTKKALNEVAKTVDPATAAQVLGCITDVPAGTTVERTERKG